ncbi:lysozyme [Vibrio navarrensis]|uniref:lysozyme n=1 Tax=Vibrio navarrensis TaxID=29495 RepID=UPI001869F0DC|nr:lysozyme [Vibrio navarrensis]MBE4617366.1 lysozyme [Vibrio navarrensis]
MRYNRLIGATLVGAVALTAAFEGKENVAYRDVGGVWTACFGETAGIEPGDSFSDAQCSAMLAKSLEKHNKPLEKLDYQLPPNVHIATLDFAYNVGVGALENSTLYRHLQRGQIQYACYQFNRWRYVTIGGEPRDCRDSQWQCRGIVTRREIETQLCLGQISVYDALLQLGQLPTDTEIINELR